MKKMDWERLQAAERALFLWTDVQRTGWFPFQGVTKSAKIRGKGSDNETLSSLNSVSPGGPTPQQWTQLEKCLTNEVPSITLKRSNVKVNKESYKVIECTDLLLGEPAPGLPARPPEPVAFFFPFRSPVPCRSMSEGLRFVLVTFFSCSFLFSSLLSLLRLSLSACTSCHQAFNCCSELHWWLLHVTGNCCVLQTISKVVTCAFYERCLKW